jgi:hypothetical protein
VGESGPAASGAPAAARRLVPVSAGRPEVTGKARQKLIEAPRASEELDPGRARHVRVVEYEVPDRDSNGKLMVLIAKITGPPEVRRACWHRRTTKDGSMRRECRS